MTAQAINLIKKAFDNNGYLINPNSIKNQLAAKKILDSGCELYDKTYNGWNIHNCLLIIAYPNKSI
jgi:hypothetical protein